MKRRILQFLQGDYRHILITGFLLSYMGVTASLALINGLSERYDRALPEFVFVTIIAATYLYFRKTGNIKLTTHLLFWTPAIHIFLLLYMNRFNDFTIIYAIILPLASFFLYELRNALIHTLCIYILLGLLVFYMRMHYPEHPFLHSPTALLNTLFGSVFVIAFGLFYQLSFYRTYLHVKHADAEKELLLKEIHHRVKNNLNVIASIIDLQARMSNVEVVKQLQLTQGRIESIAIVHEMLYQENNDFAKISFEDYMYKLGDVLQRLHAREDITFRIETNGLTLPIGVILDLGLISNELITNSYKHAFHGVSDPVIEISLLKNDATTYQYRYHDNGTGVATAVFGAKTKGLGLRLIQLSAKKMEALLEVYDTVGFTMTLDFSCNSDVNYQ